MACDAWHVLPLKHMPHSTYNSTTPQAQADSTTPQPSGHVTTDQKQRRADGALSFTG